MIKTNIISIKREYLAIGIAALLSTGVSSANCTPEKISEITFKPGKVILSQTGKAELKLLKRLSDKLDNLTLKGYPDRLGRKRTVFIGYQFSESGINDLDYKLTKEVKPGHVEVWTGCKSSQLRETPMRHRATEKRTYVWKPNVLLSKTLSSWLQKPILVENYDAKLQSGGAIFEISPMQASKILAKKAGCRLSYAGTQYRLDCTK